MDLFKKMTPEEAVQFIRKNVHSEKELDAVIKELKKEVKAREKEAASETKKN